MSEFVDANIFIRFLTKDDPAKARQCGELLRRAEAGDYDLVTSEAIVAEVVYVLASRAHYARTRPEISAALRVLIGSKAVRVDHKSSVLDAFDLYEATKLDFEDCLAVVHAKRATEGRIFSYDKGYDRIDTVTRLEPLFHEDSPGHSS